jgi:hypothetical protein
MNPMQNQRRIRAIVFTILMLASAGLGYQASSAGVAPFDEVFSYEMWCLEMSLYPSQSCDARRPDDVKAYQVYRSTTERYLENRAAGDKRDQQIHDQLDRDTAEHKQAPSGK